MVVNSTEKLLELIKQYDIAIYGIGYVAEHFYDSLILRNCKDSIKCFITTEKQVQQYKGYPVFSLKEYKEKKEFSEYLICIAVHESVRDEIIDKLEKVCITNYIWIYPFQHELRFGKAKHYAKEIELSKIIYRLRTDYRLAIRLLAIDQFYGRNDSGYEIYVKAQSMHCEHKTARSRLNNYIELIANWSTNGFDSDSRPKITDEYELIDGAHRIALAFYHGMKTICCDVYHSNVGKEYRNNEVDLTKEIIEKVGFSQWEKQMILNKASEYCNISRESSHSNI